jgi:signal peptidase I
MTLTLPVVLMGGALVLGFVVSVAALWLAARICRTPEGGLRRAFVVALVLGMVGVLCAFLESAPFFENHATAAEVVFSLLGILAALACIRRGYRTGWGRTVLVAGAFAAIYFCLTVPPILASRRWLMEAFEIPMGSSALALMGTHVEVICPSCGLQLAIGIRPDDLAVRLEPGPPAVRCDNCGGACEIPQLLALCEGDRILVNKTSRGLQRWRLVAYRFPVDRKAVYATRLVGLPGETVEILDGDVFIDGKRSVKPPGTAEEMWQPVHDTLYRPAVPAPDAPRWEARSESPRWKATSTGWDFEGAGAGTEWLDYQGPLNDAMSYNALDGRTFQDEKVNDVKVEVFLDRLEGDGGLVFRWERGRRWVVASLAASGEAGISSEGASASGAAAPGPWRGRTVEFQFRDGWAHLSALMDKGDGERVLASLEVGSQGIEEARKLDLAAPCRVSLGARACVASISRICLWRDVRYRGSQGMNGVMGNTFKLGPLECFVLGDNSRISYDSRYWRTVDKELEGKCQPGAVYTEDILGPVVFIFFPFDRWREFR